MAEIIVTVWYNLGICSTRLSAAAMVQDPNGRDMPLTKARTKHSHWDNEGEAQSRADKKRQAKAGVRSP